MESLIKLAIQARIICLLVHYLVLIDAHSTLAKLDNLSVAILLHGVFRTMETRSEHFQLRIILGGVALMRRF